MVILSVDVLLTRDCQLTNWLYQVTWWQWTKLPFNLKQWNKSKWLTYIWFNYLFLSSILCTCCTPGETMKYNFFFFSYTLPYFRLSKQFQLIVVSQKIIAKPLQILNNSMLSIIEIYLLSLRSSLLNTCWLTLLAGHPSKEKDRS